MEQQQDGSEPSESLGRGRERGDDHNSSIAEASTSTNLGTKRPSTGASGPAQKRGNLREMRTIPIIKTRPAELNSKEGLTGKKITLTANYFRLIKRPNFEFCQYRVDFDPEIDIAGMRKSFVGKQRETLGGYLYDGVSSIYLTRRLPDEITIFECESREGQHYKMILKNTGTSIEVTNSMTTHVLNLILRRAMDGLKMQLVGRNFYDPQNKVR
jgi:aubergine